ncbi:TATA box-binding protein-associated factor RNA polymerase I subunit C, putative [Theobroma cacao]|uniref:TATA box-binding protein-associated factor RNA polymerase I subunit C, putative n=1 Tax=Theobroma cacao TaxID=3641 RepID=A0A061EYC2_THECC|nr:TATA box-binding protein-associated factor RNA polymerase I subunit C, putative [Theobroma cacao]
MELSEEWKSYFPIGKSLDPPLLLSSASPGPLFFIPKPRTLPKTLFSSPSLFPPLHPPPSRLSFSRFLSTSSVPYSASSSIASRFGLESFYDDAASSSFLSHNRLHLLHCPDQNIAVVFFTTGANHDRIGFFAVHVQDNDFKFLGDRDGDILISHNHCNHKILRILVSPVDDDDFEENSGDSVVGYLMACTLYSVHWYSVKFVKSSKSPALDYLGCKLFKSSSIVSACFSPHLPQESMVLLENGALFFFDLESDVNCQIPNAYFKGNKLRVLWNDSSGSENYKWLGVEFSWHPRILIVARSDAVFLVDNRLDQCNVICLAKVEMLSPYTVDEEDQFLAFSRAGADGFQFVLASRSLLVLCDVRKPMMPLLRWAHNLDNPCYIHVFRLSELRSQSRDDRYHWATESGFCIILGSFWNCEFRLFCYGPSPASEGSTASEIAKFCKPFLAWDLPSDLSLSSRECHCGSCLVREEFSKGALPEWVDWQQKKDIVLGFGILNRDISELVCESDEFGGFTLIRLMSSGKIETQRYCASWDLVQKLDVGHREPLLNFEDSLLYSFGDDEYKFPKKFKYLNLDYLRGYLNGNVAEVLDSKMKSCKGPLEKESFGLDFHEILCEKLKVCGFGRFRSSPPLAIVFNDISSPTSICEVASRQMWATLPLELLLLAFSGYSDLFDAPFDDNTMPLKFSVVPDLPQLPPFLLRKPSCCSTKWSHKVWPDDSLVGPVLPLPVLLTLHEFRNGCPDSENMCEYSSEVELGLRCNEVMQVAAEMAVSDSSLLDNDEAISLADDRDGMWLDSQRPKPFFLYHPVGGEPSSTGQLQGNHMYKDEKFITMITKVHEKEADSSVTMANVGLELFDDLCLIELKFDVPAMNFMSQELEAYKTLKRQFSKWQEHFNPYQELCKQNNLNSQRRE